MRAPGMDDHAVADQRMNDRGAGADRAVAADATPGPITAPAPISVPAPISASRSDHRQRIDRDARFEPRGRMNAARPTQRPLVSNSEEGRSAAGNSARATATKAR